MYIQFIINAQEHKVLHTVQYSLSQVIFRKLLVCSQDSTPNVDLNGCIYCSCLFIWVREMCPYGLIDFRFQWCSLWRLLIMPCLHLCHSWPKYSSYMQEEFKIYSKFYRVHVAWPILDWWSLFSWFNFTNTIRNEEYLQTLMQCWERFRKAISGPRRRLEWIEQ